MDSHPPIEVPNSDADWDVIWLFALSFNGYERYGGELAKLAHSVEGKWGEERELPDDLFELRSTLFFVQRQQHHWGWGPEGQRAEYIRDLVRKIGEVSGGWLAGPHDFEVADAKFEAMIKAIDEERSE